MIANDALEVSNPAWSLLLILQQIVEIVTSHELVSSNIAVLDMLIKDYLDGRTSQFPSKSLRPKHHYMAHYPQLMFIFGPLIHVWTMRFESKHSYFKECIRRVKNFKNVTKTLSHKHQLLQAYYGTGSLIGPSVVVEQAAPLDLEVYNEKIGSVLLQYFPQGTSVNDLSVVINVTASGIAYKQKQFVHVGNTEHTLLFGEIILTLCDSEQNVFFVVKVKNFVQTHMRTYTLQSNDKSSSMSE